MSKILAGLLLATGLFGASNIMSVKANIQELKKFTVEQKVVMYQGFRYGYNDDMGYSMAMLGWQESKSGKDKVNLEDPSFGIYHNLLGTVINREKVPNSAYYRNKYANKLVQNDDFARSQALSELLYWKSYHLARTGKVGLWQKTIRSYNAGGNWSGKDAEAYFQNIKNKLKALKQVKFFDGLEKKMTKIK